MRNYGFNHFRFSLTGEYCAGGFERRNIKSFERIYAVEFYRTLTNKDVTRRLKEIMFKNTVQAMLEQGIKIDDIIMDMSDALSKVVKIKGHHVHSNKVQICLKELTRVLATIDEQRNMNISFDTDLAPSIILELDDAHVYQYMDKCISEMHLKEGFEDAITGIITVSMTDRDDEHPLVSFNTCDSNDEAWQLTDDVMEALEREIVAIEGNDTSECKSVFEGEHGTNEGLAKSFMTIDGFDANRLDLINSGQYIGDSSVKH
jgi:hypothetical protein